MDNVTANSKVFINVPVNDLNKSKTFFGKLGFSFNPQFTDENAACMVVNDNIYVMLLTKAYFQTFTPKAISDARTSTEVLVALSLDDRTAVDRIVSEALSAGGSSYSEPKDHGFMYAHGFQDPDGHIWEVFHMDPAFVQPQ